MSQIAKRDASELHTARDLASQCQLPLPTVSKLLKVLLHHGRIAEPRVGTVWHESHT